MISNLFIAVSPFSFAKHKGCHFYSPTLIYFYSFPSLNKDKKYLLLCQVKIKKIFLTLKKILPWKCDNYVILSFLVKISYTKKVSRLPTVCLLFSLYLFFYLLSLLITSSLALSIGLLFLLCRSWHI